MISARLPLAPAGPPAATCCAPAAGLDQDLDADRLAAVAKAMADPLRVQLLDVLRRSDAPACQCELNALFPDLRQSLLAHHLRKLVESGLASVERRHRWAYYSFCPHALQELTTWLS